VIKSWRVWATSLAVLAALTGCRDFGVQPSRGDLTVEPERVDFGHVALGREASMKMRLTNNSRVTYSIADIALTVPNVRIAEFQPFTLGSGQTQDFEVLFAPAVEGEVSGAVSILTDDSPEPRNVKVKGIGVEAFVSVSTAALQFGQVELLTTKVLNLLVHNPTGVSAPLRFTIEGDDIDVFSSSLANQNLLIEPGEQRQIPVAFNPIRLGLGTASARFEVCHGCEPTIVSLTGEGIANELEIFPTRIDFGRVALGATAEQTVTVVNHGSGPIPWNDSRLVNAPPGVLEVFSTPPGGNGTLLQPGMAAAGRVTVRFTPAVPGPLNNVSLELGVKSPDSNKSLKVGVLGEGGASCVTVLPRDLDFGTVPEGMSATRSVDVLNRCQVDVTLMELTASAHLGGFFSLPQMPSSTLIPVGTIHKVRVTYTPKPGEPVAKGSLTLRIQEGQALATQQVPLSGTSKEFSPCSWSLLPSQLDFGAVPVGSEVSLGIALRNTGTEQCFVGGMQLASGSDASFSSNSEPSLILDPGQKATLVVSFKPMAVGTFNGLAEAWVNHPTNNHPMAPITGQAVEGCFKLQPTRVDYGTRKLSCGPLTRVIEAYNTCSAPVTMSAVSLDAPATNEFAIVSQPSMPSVLNPGTKTSFTLRYAPTDEGLDSAALRVTADAVTYTAGLLGTGLNQPTKTDLFVQDSLSKVDVLLVVDNSGSMMEEQQSLAQNFAAFLSAAQAANVDYRIAVTTTGIEPSPGGWSVCPGGAEGGEAGRFFPVDGSSPRILTPQTPNASAVFANNVKVGWCHWNEQGIEAAYRALSPPLVNSVSDPSTPLPNDGNAGFLRQDAKLAIVFVSDENDFTVGIVNDDVSFYETFFKALKGNDPSLLSISAIVAPENLGSCPTASSSGIRYMKLARATGGVVESICTPNWAASLNAIGGNAFGPRRVFQLTEQPSDKSQITVHVNGVPASGWTYDPLTNSVIFTEASTPGAGAVVQITYPLGC
jgi:hypothetical protein